MSTVPQALANARTTLDNVHSSIEDLISQLYAATRHLTPAEAECVRRAVRALGSATDALESASEISATDEGLYNGLKSSK